MTGRTPLGDQIRGLGYSQKLEGYGNKTQRPRMVRIMGGIFLKGLTKDLEKKNLFFGQGCMSFFHNLFDFGNDLWISVRQVF